MTNLISATRRVLFIGGVALSTVASFTPNARAQSQPSGGAPDAGNPPQKWQGGLFPLMGESAAARGIKLPLPFGVGVNYADQAIDISRVAVGANGGEPVDLTDVIVFDKVRSQVQVMNARFDMWLFPFLNVYYPLRPVG